MVGHRSIPGVLALAVLAPSPSGARPSPRGFRPGTSGHALAQESSWREVSGRLYAGGRFVEALAHLGQYDEAREAAEILARACALEPASEEAVFKLALAEHLAGREEKARLVRQRFQAPREENRRLAAWEAGLTGGPGDRLVLERLAAAYEGRGQGLEALRTLHGLLALFPPRAEYALRIGRLGLALGRSEEAGQARASRDAAPGGSARRDGGFRPPRRPPW